MRSAPEFGKEPPLLRNLESDIGEILFWVWNPIGVKDVGFANRDEYDSYVGPIVETLISELPPASKTRKIRAHLRKMRIEHMGCREDKPADKVVTEHCLDAYSAWKQGYTHL